MNAQIKQKWVEALRSGYYNQGRKLLRQNNEDTKNKDEFCCLGVLCDIHSKETGLEWTLLEDNLCRKGVYAYSKEGCVLPDCVIDWAELGTRHVRCGSIHYEGLPQTLAYVNDAMKLSFLQIADIIEAQL